MSEASFASLGPTLLARKGGAKPAMRPQLAPLPEMTGSAADEQLEDLGWNDMGTEDEVLVDGAKTGSAKDSSESGQVVSITNSAKRVAANDTPDIDPETALIQTKPASVKTKAAAKKATKPKAKPTAAAKPSKNARRAAFTLRLDTDRHLKLRLAATMQGISAQALVTQAIDATFSEIEDLDSLVNRMKRT